MEKNRKKWDVKTDESNRGKKTAKILWQIEGGKESRLRIDTTSPPAGRHKIAHPRPLFPFSLPSYYRKVSSPSRLARGWRVKLRGIRITHRKSDSKQQMVCNIGKVLCEAFRIERRGKKGKWWMSGRGMAPGNVGREVKKDSRKTRTRSVMNRDQVIKRKVNML